MSLYVGHLPPHIRPEELIRVFRKFGHCELQLKDGYGFVIYEVIADAERALRVLRGKNICGEQIILNWSNRQPRPHQGLARPRRNFEHFPGKNFKEEDNGVYTKHCQDGKEFSRSGPHISAYYRGRRRDDLYHKETRHACEVIDDVGREREMSLREVVIEEGNATESKPIENDRWGDPFSDALTGDGVGNSSEFDRYEPYHGYEKIDEKENDQMATTYSSPDHAGSQGRGQGDNSYDETHKKLDKLKPRRTCYNCRQIGHIKRYCPELDARQERFSKFNNRREEINFRGRGDGKLKMLRTNSRGRRDTSRGPLMSRHHEYDKKVSRSRNSSILIRRSGSYTGRRDKSQLKLQTQSRTKKRSKQESEVQKKALKKRRRRSYTSSLSSDSSRSSSSRSKSSSSRSRATSRSTSTSSSRSLSPSSRSRSVSFSPYAKSKGSASRSRSNTGFLQSLSLSVELEKKPKSPTNGSLDHPRSPISKHLLPESSELKDENTLVKLKDDDELGGQYLGRHTHDARFSSSVVGYKENSTTVSLPKSVAISEKSNLQGALVTDSKMQSSARCEGRDPVKITTQEMVLALKHYGLPAPNEGDSSISVEEHFGAARLWPWEMIYYRRLKKGPMSTENYARRLEQNREFGIVDKYVRSSSGWFE